MQSRHPSFRGITVLKNETIHWTSWVALILVAAAASFGVFLEVGF